MENFTKFHPSVIFHPKGHPLSWSLWGHYMFVTNMSPSSGLTCHIFPFTKECGDGNWAFGASHLLWKWSEFCYMFRSSFFWCHPKCLFLASPWTLNHCEWSPISSKNLCWKYLKIDHDVTIAPMFNVFEKWSWVGLYGVRMLLMQYRGVVHGLSCFFSLQNFLISSQLPIKKTKPRKKRRGEGEMNHLSFCFLSH
jgi:hypothetical protein